MGHLRQSVPQNGRVHLLGIDITQNNPRVRKILCPQFWGRKWLREFYGRPENAFFLQEKAMSIKFLVLGGVYFGFGGGGGSADFIFMGARIFLNKCSANSFGGGGSGDCNVNRRRTNVQQQTCKIDLSNFFYYFFFSFVLIELKPLVLKGKVLGEKF